MLLTLLPTRPRRVDTATLEERLRSRGLAIHRRTIQRDLVELATVFPIVADERSKPYGWRWDDGSDLVSALFTRDPTACEASVRQLRLRVAIDQATAISLALRSRREARGEVRATTIGCAAEIVAQVSDCEALRRWLLGLADVVEVVAPCDLRQAVVEMATKSLANHGAGRGGGDSV
jgi:predicted DNA-binding transcriptional regulator YafY